MSDGASAILDISAFVFLSFVVLSLHLSLLFKWRLSWKKKKMMSNTSIHQSGFSNQDLPHSPDAADYLGL